ncbi:MAG: potassium channel family protein [Brevinemataceae bacterium]
MAQSSFQKQTFLVVGLGVFGHQIALSLSQSESEIIVVDNRINIIQKVKDLPVFPFQLDATNEEAWKQLDINKVDCAIICIGENMMASVLTTLLLKKFQIPRIIARANSEEHAQILQLINASEIIRPEIESAEKLAANLVGGKGFVLSYERIWKDHAIIEVQVNKQIAGQTLVNLNLRKLYKVNVIAIKHPILRVDEDFQNTTEYEIDEVPNPHEELIEGDILIILGKLSDIKGLQQSAIGRMR